MATRDREMTYSTATDDLTPSWSGRQTALAVAAVLAAWALAAAAWPLTGSVVPWDSKNQFYPFLR